MSRHSLYGSNAGWDFTRNKFQAKGYSAYDPANPGNKIILPDANTVAFFDDFEGDVVADQWNFTEGTDSTTSDGAISAAVNGLFLLTPGDSAGTVAADGSQLNRELNWQARQNLWFHTRLKLAAITSVSCFFGFTDTKALEQAIYSAGSGNTLTTDATDAVGFMFDTAMTAVNWWAVGVANDVDATAQNLAVAPVADTWATFSIQLNYDPVANGIAADFYYNGQPIGSKMSAACRYNIALTPCFLVRPKSAVAGKTMSIDYINVAGDRI
jgi:hypothetical protein